MSKKYGYENYIGNNDFVFIRCVKADSTKCVSYVEKLSQNGVKVFFDIQGSSDAEKPSKVAQAIYTCGTALFFISKNSCESLEFRNSINYAMEIQKNTVYVALEDEPLAHGLEMQLANVPRIDLTDDFEEKLKAYGVITQDVLGAEPVRKHVDIKKKLIMSGVILALTALFVIAAVAIIKDRVAYYNSPQWILRDMDGSEYVNISAYGETGIRALAGMDIGEIDLTGSDINDLSAIQDVRAEVLNITDCKDLRDIGPVLKCEGLRTVKISQDMLKYVYDLRYQGIEFEVTK